MVEESAEIERVQKYILYIALGNGYNNYKEALDKASLETLEERREQICLNFAVKASNHPKHKDWFIPNKPPGPKTRRDKVEYKQPFGRPSRFKNSPIPYLTAQQCLIMYTYRTSEL